MADTPAQIAAKKKAATTKAAADKIIADKKAAAAKLILTDDQIIEQMKTQTPWIYQTYMSPVFTSEMKTTLINWARQSSAGLKPTDDQIQKDTYNWPMAQLWSVNQANKFNLSFTAPGEYKAQLQGTTAAVDKYILQSGNTVDASTRQDIINDIFLKGWASNDPRIQDIIASKFIAGKAMTGTALNAVDQVKSIAANYMIALDAQTLQRWGQAVQGGTPLADVTAYFKGQAASLYHFMAGSIDHISPSDWFAPAKTLISNNLEIPVSQIDFNDPSGKWLALVTKKDPKTGETIARSNSEIIDEARNNPLYGYDKTMGAQNSAYDLAAKIKGVFNRGAGVAY
ncbi:MAG: hypothetical protein D4R39_04250 [Methylophilaceae bacterium]|nr:MAG: hypothetical protein D4R39_04250 [Methylophilaceae bacterium]